jgi:hypothetical protein
MKNLLMALVAVGFMVGCGGDTGTKKETTVKKTDTSPAGTTTTTVKKTEEVKTDTNKDANKKP